MPSIQQNLPEVRAVHNLERYSIARSNADTFYNVITGPRIRPVSEHHYHPQTDNPAEWAQFLAGPLTWLINQHVTLSVAVRDHLSSKPWFVQLPSIDLTRIVRVMTVPNLEAIGIVLESEHNYRFDLSDLSLPLWHIVVVRIESDGSFYLLYNFHHAIGDGRSSMALTEQLHEQLNEAVKNPPNGPIPVVVPSPKDKEMYLPLERRVSCNPKLKTLVKAVLPELFLPKAIKRALGPKYWSGDVDATLGSNITQFDILRLTKEETALVVQAAKKHNTTVQSLFYAAAVFAAQSCFIHPRLLKKEKIGRVQKVSTPVALRNLIPNTIGRNEQGTFVSEHFHAVKVKQHSSFWGIANDYRQSVVRATQTKGGVRGLLEYIGMLQYLPKQPGGWETFLKDMVKSELHGRRETILISNLGLGWNVCNIPLEEQAYVVEDALFSQSAEITGPTFSYSVVTANGVLTATNTWQSAALHDRERGEWFTRETKRVMLEASRPDRSDLLFQEAYDSRENLHF